MGKVELNKLQKKTSLLNTAFRLFTTKGVNETSVAEISEQAGIAKGTFYLYFKDKYDIRNILISHEASKLFTAATDALAARQAQGGSGTPESFEDQLIFVADHIIDTLSNDKVLLNFISKNLSWGVFKKALENTAETDVNFREVYYDMIERSGYTFRDPEIMLYLIIELVSSASYSAILYSEPADIRAIKPYLYNTIRAIIANHGQAAQSDSTAATDLPGAFSSR